DHVRLGEPDHHGLRRGTPRRAGTPRRLARAGRPAPGRAADRRYRPGSPPGGDRQRGGAGRGPPGRAPGWPAVRPPPPPPPRRRGGRAPGRAPPPAAPWPPAAPPPGAERAAALHAEGQAATANMRPVLGARLLRTALRHLDGHPDTAATRRLRGRILVSL